MAIRKYTNLILEQVEEGLISERELITRLLGYMSEADVQDFYESEYDNGLLEEYEEDDLDGPDEQSAWYDTSAELM